MADGKPGSDKGFLDELDNLKNPFEDGIPKPPVVEVKPVVQVEQPLPVQQYIPKPVEMPKPAPAPVVLPTLTLQGVMVGGDMHEAIINDEIVPLMGTIQGAQVISVSKEGVGLSYGGKKFFLKVD